MLFRNQTTKSETANFVGCVVTASKELGPSRRRFGFGRSIGFGCFRLVAGFPAEVGS
jgi:hypothetical protein